MNTIPLHQLPEEAFKCVLQSMEIYDQLAYSLCSRNTKKAIKSLNLTAEEINLCISNSIEFDIRFKNYLVFWTYMDYGYYFLDEEFRVPVCIKVSASDNTNETLAEWELKFQNFAIEEWLHHFCEVLHHPRLDDLFFNDNRINNDFIKPVQIVIEGLQLVSFSLGELLTPEFTKKALESFHNYDKFDIDRVPFGRYEVQKMDKFLVQNLSKLCIRRAERLHIDHVLLANCEKLKLMRTMFTDKDLNVFLKLWICGSNSRLKYFYTCRENLPEQQNRPFDEEVFFQGMNRTKIPLDSQEVYREKVHENYYNETKLAGGSRIKRFDGTTAVVLIGRFGFHFIQIETDERRRKRHYEETAFLRIDNLCFSDDLYLYGDDEIEGDFIKPVQKVIEGLYIASFALKLHIGRVPFDNNEFHKIDKFLVQNLSKVSVAEAERLKIDQVLMSNSKRIEAERSTFTDKDLNRVLKLWICGSNPRLKHFCTTGQPKFGSDQFDENLILKGIKPNRIPLDSQEVYREQVSENYCKETKLAGGYRIWRFDGTKAVVLIKGRSFELIVD
ncbi:unnamed protein product [Caenorhabditis brenneri]